MARARLRREQGDGDDREEVRRATKTTAKRAATTTGRTAPPSSKRSAATAKRAASKTAAAATSHYGPPVTCLDSPSRRSQFTADEPRPDHDPVRGTRPLKVYGQHQREHEQRPPG